jgi:hypothetical protein
MLETKARALAGSKGYTTNLTEQGAEFVIGAYQRLFQIERSFRMSKHDLAARPIYHHKRASIEAHLSIVFAALAVSRLVDGPHRTPAADSSRRRTPYPRIYTTRSPRSAGPNLRTNVSQVGS